MKPIAEDALVPVLLWRIIAQDSLLVIWASLATGEVVHTTLHSYN